MIFTKLYKSFASNEAGAVSVDWVALTAVIVLFGTGTLVAVNDHIQALSDDIGTHVANQDLG